MAAITPDATPSTSTRAIAAAGLDHVVCGDHVSFIVGAGFDGLIGATHELATEPSLRAFVAVYLLPLRHPVLVARQLSSVSERYPGRLTFGVGVGGEDPHELEICGIDPRTRGRRMDEVPRRPSGVARRSTGDAPRRVLRPGRRVDPARAATRHPHHRRRSIRRRAPPRRTLRRRLDRHLELGATVRGSDRHHRRRRRTPPAGGTSNGNTRCKSGAASETIPPADARHSLRPWKACTASRSNDSSATAPAVTPRPSPNSWRRTSRPVAERSTCSRAPRTSTRRSPASPRSAASSMIVAPHS